MKVRGRALIKWGLLIILSGLLFWHFVLPWIPIKTAMAYPMLRKRWDPDLVAHFPPKQPEGSETAGFFFNWGLLQPSTVMEWRVTFEEASFSREMQRLSRIPATDDGRAHGPTYIKQHYWTVTIQEAGFTPRILHALPTVYGDDPSWNHGLTYGYAVRKNSREIVYWVEDW